MSSSPQVVPASEEAPRDPRLEEFRRQVFLAALTGIMASPLNWDMDGKSATRINDRVELAWRTADRSLAKSGLI